MLRLATPPHTAWARQVIRLNEQSSTIDVTLRKGGEYDAGALFPLAARLSLLVKSVISQHFSSLQCQLLVAPPDGSGWPEHAELAWLEHGALSSNRDAGKEVVLSVSAQSGAARHSRDLYKTVGELRELVRPWLRPDQPPSSFHLFLSYQQSSDADFTNLVYDCCSANGTVDIFLDRCTLSVGTQLGTACLLALAHTRVIVPVVTCSALRRLSAVTAESGMNYLLLEWTFAVLLHTLHGHHILPIFVGADSSGADAFQGDLFQARPPRVGGDGKPLVGDDGKPVADSRALEDRVPDVVVKAVHDELRRFYERHRQALPPEAEKLTAAEVVKRIRSTAGLTTWRAESGHAPRVDDDWGLHEGLAEKLVEKAVAAPAPGQDFAQPAYGDTVSKAFEAHAERMDQKMDQLLQGQRRGSGRLKQLHREQQEMRSDLKAILQMGEAHFKMLSTLMHGVDKLAPKLICFLPAVEYKKGWLSALKSPKDWFNQRVRIFFVDPITLTLAQTNGGKGFELKFPKEWVAKAMPYVKLGLTLLKVAAVAGKLAGIPIPDVQAVAGEWVDSQLSMLTSLKDHALKEMSEMTKDAGLAAELLRKVDSQCARLLENKLDEARVVEGSALSEQLHAPLEKSLRELDALLRKSYPDWKDECGLVLTTARDGETEWVLPEHVEGFRDRFSVGAEGGEKVAAAGKAAVAPEKAAVAPEKAAERAAAEPSSSEDAKVTPSSRAYLPRTPPCLPRTPPEPRSAFKVPLRTPPCPSTVGSAGGVAVLRVLARTRRRRHVLEGARGRRRRQGRRPGRAGGGRLAGRR